MVQDVRHDSRVYIAGQVFDVDAKVEIRQVGLFTRGLELCAHCFSETWLYCFNHVQLGVLSRGWMIANLYYPFSSLPVFKFNKSEQKVVN